MNPLCLLTAAKKHLNSQSRHVEATKPQWEIKEGDAHGIGIPQPRERSPRNPINTLWVCLTNRAGREKQTVIALGYM